MRLSWLDPRTVDAARAALGDPDPPAGVDPARWPAIENLVHRAEVVSQVVRTQGVDAATLQFGNSEHAVEVAVVIMASAAVDRASVRQIRALIDCEIDEEILYGTFLRLLVEIERSRTESIAIYEEFHDKVARHVSSHPQWDDRVAVIREGLAELYIASARYDEGHEVFLDRHNEDTGDVAVALTASRAFLTASQPSRAAEWLGRAADRAAQLGRSAMESTLLEKKRALEKRAAKD